MEFASNMGPGLADEWSSVGDQNGGNGDSGYVQTWRFLRISLTYRFALGGRGGTLLGLLLTGL